MENPIDVTRITRGSGAAARCPGAPERVRLAFRNAALWGAIGLICAVIAPGTVQAQGDAQTGVSEVVVRSFAAPPRGAYPYAGLVRDSAGNLYGTALFGGSAGAGVVYKVDARGRQTFLYNFAGGSDGDSPYAGVVLDSAGNLYGTTAGGGAGGGGVVYKLDSSGNETVLHSFTYGSDGGIPQAGVVLDSAGNLYGTTQFGGSAGLGVVYKLDPSGNETVLHNFALWDGGAPWAGVVLDPAGNLYGTTSLGGPAGSGVVYKLDPSGNETVLHNFTGGADGASPYAGVVLDAAGNLYGTTAYGGSASLGIVYKLDPSGNETVLHNFTGGTDGANPSAGVVLDSSGSLYGATYRGGASGQGVVFKLASGNTETLLYVFPAVPDGWYPISGLTRDSAGNLYGTTYYGGTAGYGAVYKVNLLGVETVLHTFTGGSDGSFPQAGVVLDSAGNLYGTAPEGGSAGYGIVYKLDPSGNETVLHNFTGGADGASPYAGVVLDAAGNLYGTTAGGGTGGRGVVYKLDPSGNETVLYSFTGGSDGRYPRAGVVLDSAGNLYGTTAYGGSASLGIVYKLDPSGNETVLHNFTGGADGAWPYAGVVLDAAGNLYGTTAGGGTAGSGVVYRVDPSANETVLHSFTYGSDGGEPLAGVVLDSVGNLYGTTQGGGPAGYAGYGVVYKLDPSGNETVLYSFTGGSDGGYPEYGNLILDSAGTLFGTASSGGSRGGGVVYKLKGAVPRR